MVSRVLETKSKRLGVMWCCIPDAVEINLNLWSSSSIRFSFIIIELDQIILQGCILLQEHVNQHFFCFHNFMFYLDSPRCVQTPKHLVSSECFDRQWRLQIFSRNISSDWDVLPATMATETFANLISRLWSGCLLILRKVRRFCWKNIYYNWNHITWDCFYILLLIHEKMSESSGSLEVCSLGLNSIIPYCIRRGWAGPVIAWELYSEWPDLET